MPVQNPNSRHVHGGRRVAHAVARALLRTPAPNSIAPENTSQAAPMRQSSGDSACHRRGTGAHTVIAGTITAPNEDSELWNLQQTQGSCNTCGTQRQRLPKHAILSVQPCIRFD